MARAGRSFPSRINYPHHGSGNVSVALSVATVAVAAPSPSVSVVLGLSVATVAITAPVPTVVTGSGVTLVPATVTIATPAPSVRTGTGLSVATVTIAAPAPGISNVKTLGLPIATVAISAPAPALGGSTVGLPVAAVTVATPAPSLSGARVALSTATVSIAALAPGLAKTVPLAVATVAIAAKPVGLVVSRSLALTTATVSVQAYPVTPQIVRTLIASIAADQTTDDFGNTIYEGFTVGEPGVYQVNMGLISLAGSQQGIINFYNPGNYYQGYILADEDSGTSGVYYHSPQELTSGLDDSAELQLIASYGTPASAGGNLVYIDTSGTKYAYVQIYCGGTFIEAAQIYAAQPGTGTSASNAAVSETWHTLSVSAGFSNTNAQYRLLPDGNVQVAGEVILPSSGSYNNVTFATMPSGYQPSTTRNWAVIPLAGSTYGNATYPGAPHAIVSSSGALSLWGIASSLNGNAVDISGIYPL